MPQKPSLFDEICKGIIIFVVALVGVALLAKLIVAVSGYYGGEDVPASVAVTLDERVSVLETRVSALEGTPTATATRKPTWTPIASPSRTAVATGTSTPVPSATRTVQPSPSSTLVATPTRSATPAPTKPLPTPVGTPSAKLPQALFVMLDWFNGDWGNSAYRYSYLDSSGHRQDYTGHPEYGALGGWTEFHWADLNPGPGVYNWAEVDKYILDAQTMPVTMPDGTVTAKPVGVAVVIWTADTSGARIGICQMPGWVIAEAGGSVMSCQSVSGCSTSLCTPKWSVTKWQTRYDEFVAAMGARYDSNSLFYNLSWVAVMTGVDGEVVASKPMAGCAFSSGDTPGFGTWCTHVQQVYAAAFPNTVTFIQPVVHNSHTFADAATGNAGVKTNGLEPDVASAELRLNNVLVGGVTGFADSHPYLPAGFEPKRGNGVEGSYWFFMQGLASHADMFDVQLPNIEQAYQCQRVIGWPLLDFVRNHLGVDVTDTPDVWCVLRDTAWEDTSYTGSDSIKRTYGPHHGDFEFWLYERRTAPNSRGVTLMAEEKERELPAMAMAHPYGWAAVRRTDQVTGNKWLSFDMDDDYSARYSSAWRITLTVLNQGNDTFSLQYVDVNGNLAQRTFTKGSALGLTGTWVDVTVDLTDACMDNGLSGGCDLRLDCSMDGNEYLHRVVVQGLNAIGPDVVLTTPSLGILERGGW